MRGSCVLLFLGVSSAACGARVSPVDAVDSGLTPDASITGTIDPRCPSSLPAAGSPCGVEELRCEWGDDPRWNCNARSRCYLGKWEAFPPDATKCPSTPIGLPPGCPSRAVAEARGTCTDTTLFCAYPEGMCTCMIESGPPLPDAGTYPPVWVCETLSPGCPRPRPRIGSACTTTDLRCDYGVCSRVDGSAFWCDGKAWSDGISTPCGGA